MLIKKSEGSPTKARVSKALEAMSAGAVNRRTFLKRSGYAAGGAALAASLPISMMKNADVQAASMGGKIKEVLSVCTFCAVGCTIKAEVKDGLWIGQEPAFDSPINNGGYCAKGAASREEAMAPRRVKYPMKLEDGKWKRLSWEQAINEIGDQMLKIRKESGPDSVTGSARPRSATNRPTCSASTPPSGARTTSTTRRASVTRPRSRGLPTPGAMVP
jgi:formate dehydrogenase major subunit